jgi:hypothetical protein
VPYLCLFFSILFRSLIAILLRHTFPHPPHASTETSC